MYDTLRIFARGINAQRALAALGKTDADKKQSFNYRGLHVTAKGGAALLIQGSIAKHIAGDNLTQVSLAEVSGALVDLCALTGIKAHRTKVTRLDVGFCLTVPRPATVYFPLILALPRTKRCTYGNETVFFKTANSVFEFYDKGLEANLADRFLLRIEYQLKQRVQEIMKWPVVTIETLTNPDFAGAALKKYWQTFRRVELSRIPRLDKRLFASYPLLRNAHFLRGLESQGMDAHELELEAAVKEGITSAANGRAIRHRIKKLRKDPRITAQQNEALALKELLRKTITQYMHDNEIPGEDQITL